MKATKTMKVMAVVLAALLMMSAMSFTVFADETLTIGAVTFTESGNDYVFTVPYEASAGVAQVSVLATVGGDTAPTPAKENIVYVNQEAKDADGFTFKVAKDKFSADADTLYVRLGGTQIATAEESSKEIVSTTGGYKVYGYTVAGAEVSVGGKTATANDAGYFEVTGVANGAQTVVITAKAAIDRTIEITVAAADYEVSTSADPVTLFVGDVSGDNTIDNTDLNGVKGVFGKPAEGNEAYDVNGDGSIDNSDLNAVKNAFGKTQADYQ